jgi:hypothetical protein
MDTKMLTDPPEEIFLRFERPKTVWFELTSNLADDFLGFVAMPLRKTLIGN